MSAAVDRSSEAVIFGSGYITIAKGDVKKRKLKRGAVLPLAGRSRRRLRRRRRGGRVHQALGLAGQWRLVLGDTRSHFHARTKGGDSGESEVI
jgi:hypothetical protein